MVDQYSSKSLNIDPHLGGFCLMCRGSGVGPTLLKFIAQILQ